MVLIPRHSESLVTGSNRSGRRSPCRRSPGCSTVGTLGQTLRLGLVHRTELVGRSSRAANVFAASACMPVALWGRTFGRSVRLCSPDIGRAACSNSRPCRPSACTPHSSAAATPGTREPAPGRPVGDDFRSGPRIRARCAPLLPRTRPPRREACSPFQGRSCQGRQHRRRINGEVGGHDLPSLNVQIYTSGMSKALPLARTVPLDRPHWIT
jgi:hypothetical protein